MIEMVTVILLVGILAVTALPRFDLLRGYDEVGYRDKVRSTLEYARKAAIAQRRFVCAVIDASGDLTLTIESVAPESGAHSASCPYARNLALPAIDRHCASGVSNMTCNPPGITLTPAASIQFDPRGRATLGSGTYTVTGESAHALTIVAETGNVQ